MWLANIYLNLILSLETILLLTLVILPDRCPSWSLNSSWVGHPNSQMRWLPIFWCSNLDIMKINIFCLLPFFVSHLEMQKNKPAEIISAAITISYPGGNLEKNFRRAEINIFRWGSFFWIHPFYRNFIFNGWKPKLPQRKWSSPVYFVAFKDKIQCSVKNKKCLFFWKLT